jgi:menaquinol-cytochrome c reductase cytochrome b subunit
MKVVLQALIGSVVIHIFYFVGMMFVSYIKTRNYKPEIASAWDHVETLQSEVVFGKVGSPFLSLITFIGVTVICGIIIFLYKKLLN